MSRPAKPRTPGRVVRAARSGKRTVTIQVTPEAARLIECLRDPAKAAAVKELAVLTREHGFTLAADLSEELSK